MTANPAYSDGYVAKEPIDIDGVRAFNPGDPVPDSHVTGGTVPRDSVVKGRAKAAEKPTEAS